MGAKYVQTGNAIDHTPTADVKAGDVIVQGELVGVAKLDIPAGKLGALHVAGNFDFPKAAGAGTAIAVGTEVYWDEAEKVAKADDEAGANKYIGKTVQAAGDDDAVVRANLSQ